MNPPKFETQPANGLERRALVPIEFRQPDEEKRTAWARVVNYNIVDDYGTEWMPGVFSESLRTKLPKVTWGHNWQEIIGQVIDYQDSQTSLDVLIQFSDFDAVPRARQAWTQMRDGDVDEMSFGFERQERTLLEDDPLIYERMVKAKLYEVSPVLVGAVPNTAVLSVREKLRQAFSEEQIVQLRELLTAEPIVASGSADPETVLEPGDPGDDDGAEAEPPGPTPEEQAAEAENIAALIEEGLQAEAVAVEALARRH